MRGGRIEVETTLPDGTDVTVPAAEDGESFVLGPEDEAAEVLKTIRRR